MNTSGFVGYSLDYMGVWGLGTKTHSGLINIVWDENDPHTNGYPGALKKDTKEVQFGVI